jgi:hypothetical protein
MTDYRYKVLKQKSIVIAAVLAMTMLTAVFTTTPPFSFNQVQGQSISQCPVGYVRDPSGICVPITRPPIDTLPTSENRTEENIVCSGFSYTCG